MMNYKVVYEDINGHTKVTYIGDVRSIEEAENKVLNNIPDVLQVINISKA